MNKKTKTILAVALVGGVGYYMWMKSKKTASFANVAGLPKKGKLLATKMTKEERKKLDKKFQENKNSPYNYPNS
jgi:hypothetical protein